MLRLFALTGFGKHLLHGLQKAPDYVHLYERIAVHNKYPFINEMLINVLPCTLLKNRARTQHKTIFGRGT